MAPQIDSPPPSPKRGKGRGGTFQAKAAVEKTLEKSQATPTQALDEPAPMAVLIPKPSLLKPEH